jgi:hypothetical protein
MTNINITMPDALHKDLKVAAAMQGKTLKEVIIDLLIEHMDEVSS